MATSLIEIVRLGTKNKRRRASAMFRDTSINFINHLINISTKYDGKHSEKVNLVKKEESRLIGKRKPKRKK